MARARNFKNRLEQLDERRVTALEKLAEQARVANLIAMVELDGDDRARINDKPGASQALEDVLVRDEATAQA